jgi:exosortase/archaeosortase family protein
MMRRLSFPNNVLLWRILAFALALQSVVFNGMTQSSDEVLFVLIAWWGAYLALDHSFPGNHLRPSVFGAWFGFLLVLWVLRISFFITSANLGSSLLPLLSGLGLALLATPVRGLRRVLPSLGILALLPLIRAALIPYPTLLTNATAFIANFALLLCGLPAMIQANMVTLPGGSVVVASACTGLPAMLQLLSVSFIFAIVFPMRYRWQNLIMAVCAMVLGFLVNGIRIAFLAVMISSQFPSKRWWFDLFHNGWPAWIFPGIAAFLFVNIYTLWLENQVAKFESE